MTITLRSHDVPPASRQEYWQQVINDTVVAMDLRYDQAPHFRSRLLAANLGAIGIAEVTDGPGAAARTRRHIRQSTTELRHIFVQGSGHVVAEQARRTTHLKPGDFTISDPSRPYRCVYPARRAICLTFPDGLMPLKDREIERLAGVRIPGDRGPAALFSTFVRQLSRHLATTDDGARARLGTSILDLLAVALGPTLDRPLPDDTRARALVQQVLTFIEERLADPALTPQTIADAHHISLRYLHKLFETQGTTVAGRIRQRRMERCRRDLLDPALGRWPVGTIGARWGYPDPAAFSRAFRAAYDLPPGEYRRAYAAATACC